MVPNTENAVRSLPPYILNSVSDMHTTAGSRIRAAAPKSHPSDHGPDGYVGL
jgi:hypothetical protein